jgi:hypothetical protein
MAAGGGYLDGSPCRRLPDDVGQVGRIIRGRRRSRLRRRGHGRVAAQPLADLGQRADADDLRVRSQPSLAEVGARHDEPTPAGAVGADYRRQHARHALDRTGQRELAHHDPLVERARRQRLGREQERKRDRQVEPATGLGDGRRQQCDRDLARRPVLTRVGHGGVNPMLDVLEHPVGQRGEDEPR